ncbi:MAG: hypothetical protein LUC34_00070, partial [Campylobacter sp.]|nr:hypothetical protein [Campylobacter sp.]
VTYAIRDSAENIQKNLDELLANLDKFKDGGINSTDDVVDLTKLSKEQFDIIKGKFDSDDKLIDPYTRTNVTWTEEELSHINTENHIFKLSNSLGSIYEIDLNGLEAGHHKIEGINNDEAIKFIGSLEAIKIDPQEPFKDGYDGYFTDERRNVFFERGNDTYLYISGDDNNTYDYAKDKLIIFKGISLSDIASGDKLKFDNLKAIVNPIADGLTAISKDGEGYLQLFGEDKAVVKIGNGFSDLYKDKDGNIFADAKGLQKLDPEANLNIKAIKFTDGKILKIAHDNYLIRSLNLDQAGDLTLESIKGNIKDGDVLIDGDTTYKFRTGGLISEIQIGNSENKADNLIFKSHPGASFSDINLDISIIGQDIITKDKFLNGEFDKKYIGYLDIVEYKDIKYTFDINNDNDEPYISKIEGYGKVGNSYTKIPLKIESLKEFKQGLIDKLGDNSISDIEQTNFDSDTLKSIKDVAVKFKDGIIRKATLNMSDVKELKDVLSKIANNAITLNSDTPLDDDILDAIGTQNISKFRNKFTDATLSADKAKDVLSKNSLKFEDKAVAINGNAEDINELLSDLQYSSWDYSRKIKSIDATDNGELTMSKELFKKLSSTLTLDDTINIKDIGVMDKDIALSGLVDKFTVKGSYSYGDSLFVNIDEFKQLKDKGVDVTYAIRDSAENIQKNLDELFGGLQNTDDLLIGSQNADNLVSIDTGANFITNDQINKIIEDVNAFGADNGMASINNDVMRNNNELMNLVMSGVSGN